jgi:hypothetical protein
LASAIPTIDLNRIAGPSGHARRPPAVGPGGIAAVAINVRLSLEDADDAIAQ